MMMNPKQYKAWLNAHKIGEGWSPVDGILVNGHPLILFENKNNECGYSVLYRGNVRHFKHADEAFMYMAKRAGEEKSPARRKGWIDPKEQLPTVGEGCEVEVLAIVSGESDDCTYDHAYNIMTFSHIPGCEPEWFSYETDYVALQVHYWRPLPEQPEEGTDDPV